MLLSTGCCMLDPDSSRLQLESRSYSVINFDDIRFKHPRFDKIIHYIRMEWRECPIRVIGCFVFLVSPIVDLHRWMHNSANNYYSVLLTTMQETCHVTTKTVSHDPYARCPNYASQCFRSPVSPGPPSWPRPLSALGSPMQAAMLREVPENVIQKEHDIQTEDKTRPEVGDQVTLEKSQ